MFRKTVGLVVGAAVACVASVAMADEATASKTVSKIQINGASGDYYFRTDAGWGAPSCPNATYVLITPDVLDRKALLAAGLTAKVSGLKLQFIGTCLDQSYFKATYVVMGD